MKFLYFVKAMYLDLKFHFKNGYSRNEFPYSIECPACLKSINYMRYSGMSNSYPHFYCSKCSNIINREADKRKVSDSELTADLLEEITSTLPSCPCGGKFQSDAHPKCPYCQHSFTNTNDPIKRLGDPVIIRIQKAKIFHS